ncbi:hypothetical protein [Pseudarthrobacter sp. fls2-241-R2A-168]|uniref:hypothetical protein n=1 Tax=Pseudarthrobacter sp. fls2-241-R2A-168 TaxID=3040304 RepID=UPI0025525C18|nr:hypothetical protein [Pseudarthrobacter sp. fls2-241-R2A-168]
MESELQATDSLAVGIGRGLEEGLKFLTNMHLVLRDKDGNIKQEERVHNTVTTAGKNGIADQILASPSLVKMGWMAVGTGSPAATLLGTETARVAFTSKTRSTNVITVVGDFPAGTATGLLGLLDVAVFGSQKKLGDDGHL